MSNELLGRRASKVPQGQLFPGFYLCPSFPVLFLGRGVAETMHHVTYTAGDPCVISAIEGVAGGVYTQCQRRVVHLGLSAINCLPSNWNPHLLESFSLGRSHKRRTELCIYRNFQHVDGSRRFDDHPRRSTPSHDAQASKN